MYFHQFFSYIQPSIRTLCYQQIYLLWSKSLLMSMIQQLSDSTYYLKSLKLLPLFNSMHVWLTICRKSKRWSTQVFYRLCLISLLTTSYKCMREQSIQYIMTSNVYYKLETTSCRSSRAAQPRQIIIYGYMLSERLQLFVKYIQPFVLRKHLS